MPKAASVIDGERFDRVLSGEIDAHDFATDVIKRVAELGDRTSPDDQPDMMLVTADELRFILLSELKPEA